MLAIVPILAEVMDKEPTSAVLLLWGIGLAVVNGWLAWRTRWGLLVGVPVAILFALVVTAEVRDPTIGPAILHEAGGGYVARACLAAVLPFAGCLVKRRWF